MGGSRSIWGKAKKANQPIPKKDKSILALSVGLIGFTLSKHTPVKYLGTTEASKPGERAGLATTASAIKLPAVIYAAACSCAGPKAGDRNLKCQVIGVG